MATHAQGRTLGDSSDFVVDSNGAAITYRTIPPRSWVQAAGKPWVAVDSGVPDGNPLDALRQPSAVADAGDGRIQATYPPAALGLVGTTSIAVILTLAADGSVQARYTVTLAAGPATSETRLVPAPSQQPIVAP